jgi:hypothetical protein
MKTFLFNLIGYIIGISIWVYNVFAAWHGAIAHHALGRDVVALWLSVLTVSTAAYFWKIGPHVWQRLTRLWVQRNIPR